MQSALALNAAVSQISPYQTWGQPVASNSVSSPWASDGTSLTSSQDRLLPILSYPSRGNGQLNPAPTQDASRPEHTGLWILGILTGIGAASLAVFFVMQRISKNKEQTSATAIIGKSGSGRTIDAMQKSDVEHFTAQIADDLEGQRFYYGKLFPEDEIRRGLTASMNSKQVVRVNGTPKAMIGIDERYPSEPHLSYYVDKDARRGGLASYGCSEVMKQLFKKEHVEAVIACPQEANEPSCTLLEKKLGFKSYGDAINEKLHHRIYDIQKPYKVLKKTREEFIAERP